MTDELRSAIRAEAARIGADPADFATLISYETAGTFDPWKVGPTTQWGQHQGLIQMGEVQRKKYGYTPDKGVADLVRASADYMVDNGYKPGMGMLDMYSIINAGAPGKYNATDAHNGGAPGTVADKVAGMTDHRLKAEKFLGITGPGNPGPLVYDNAPAATTVLPGVTPGPADYSFLNTPVAQRESATQTWMQQNFDYNTPQDTAEAPSYWDAFKTAYEGEIAPFGYYTDQRFGPDDPNFTGPAKTEAFKKYSENMPTGFAVQLMDTKSEQQMAVLSEYMNAQIKREEELSKLGWGGVGVSMLAAMLEPVSLTAAVLTEGAAAPVLAGAKLSRLGRIGASALSGGVSNVAAEAALGVWNPTYQENLALAFGTGALLTGTLQTMLGRAGTESEAALVRDAGQKLIGTGAAGAQQAGSGVISIDAITALTDLAESSVNRPAFANARMDIMATLSKAGADVRLLSQYLAQEGVAVRDAEGVIMTVETPATQRKLRMQLASINNLGSDLLPMFREWAEATKTKANQANWDAFNEQVSDIVDLGGDVTKAHPKLAAAVKRYEKFYGEWSDLANNPGKNIGETLDAIPGLSSKRDNYRPMVPDYNRVSQMFATHGEGKLLRVAKEALKSGIDELDDALADKVAAKWLAGIRRAGYGQLDTFNSALARGEKAELIDFLIEDLKVDSDTADAFVEKVMKMNARRDNKSPTSRGKRRVGIDYSFEMEGVRIRDFYSKNAFHAAERYADEISGWVSLAQTRIKHPKTGEVLIDGIRTKADWMKLLNGINERMLKDRVDPAQAAKTIERLQYIFDHIVGRPRVGSQAAQTYLSWVRRAMKIAYNTLMQNMGLYAIQEMGHIPIAVNMKAFLRQAPNAMNTVLRAKGREKKTLVTELMALTGDGFDTIMNFTRHAGQERIGEDVGNKFGDKVDRFNNSMSKIVNNTSLFNPAQAVSQQMAMSVIAQNFSDLALKHFDKLQAGTFKMNDINTLFGRADADRMRIIGLDDKTLANVLKNMKQHAKRDGNRLVSLNMEDWDPKAAGDFSNALFQWTGRVIQRQDIGNLAMWMTQPMAGLLVQFRNFMHGAWAKQTLHGIAMRDPRALGIVTAQALSGMALYALTQKVNSLGADDPEKFMEDRASLDKIIMQGIARAPSSSVIPMMVDSGAMLTTGSPMFQYARQSGQPSDLVLGSAVYGRSNDLLKSIMYASSMIRDGRQPSQEELKTMSRLIGNWIPYTVGTSWLLNQTDLPERKPKN